MQMTEELRNHIVDQLRGFYDGKNWVSDHFVAAMSAISPTAAAMKAPGHPKSIAEQVLHMVAWRVFVVERLKGNDVFDIELNSEVDWPVADSWSNTLDLMKTTNESLIQAIRGFAIEKGQDLVPGRKYTFSFLLQGIIHHDFYHFGKIQALAAEIARS